MNTSNYLILLFLIITLFSCSINTEKSQLSIVLLSNDTIATYNGPLHKYGETNKFHMSASSLDKIIVDNSKKYGEGFSVIIKPSPCDGEVGAKMSEIINVLRKDDVSYSSSLELTADESVYFNSQGREDCYEQLNNLCPSCLFTPLKNKSIKLISIKYQIFASPRLSGKKIISKKINGN